MEWAGLCEYYWPVWFVLCVDDSPAFLLCCVLRLIVSEIRDERKNASIFDVTFVARFFFSFVLASAHLSRLLSTFLLFLCSLSTVDSKFALSCQRIGGRGRLSSFSSVLYLSCCPVGRLWGSFLDGSPHRFNSIAI
jgi:hypothetical protein